MDLHFEDSTFNSLNRFEKMLKTDSVFFFDSIEFEEIIAYYIDNGKIALAKKALDLATHQHPGTLEIKVLKAELLIIENKLNEADELLDELSFIDPDNEEIYIQKAQLLSKQDHHELAIDHLLVALDMTDSEFHIDILSMLGMEYLFLEKFNIARDYFKQCIAMDPMDTSFLHNIIYCYDMDNAQLEAIEFLRAYIEINPYSEIAWHQLGKENYTLERYQEALEAFDFAIIIDEKFMGAYLEKAKTLEKLHRYAHAIKWYELTTKMEDPMSFAYLRMGHCYARLSDSEKALISYHKASELDPNLEAPILAIIELLYKEHQYHEVLSYANRLINMDDENIKYLKLYGDINMKNAFFNEAVEVYKKCITLGDDKLDTFLRLADAYYYLGDYQKAIDVLNDIEKMYPQHHKISIRLSGLYFLNENLDKGLEYFKQYIQIKPGNIRLFRQLFPAVINKKSIQELLNKHQLI